MYMSQEMPNLRCFLARFMSCDNQMTIIFENIGVSNLLLFKINLVKWKVKIIIF